MGTKTKNYNLIKPSENDVVDISIFNENSDIIDYELNKNKEEISVVNKNLSNAIMKDGSVQMTGVLKTIGGNVTAEQIALGDKCFIYSNNVTGIITIATNAKTDDGTNWTRVIEGTSFAVNISKDGYMSSCHGISGMADSVIVWIDDGGMFLTAKTGLPKTGGTLSGALCINNNNTSNWLRLQFDGFDSQIFSSSNGGGNGYNFCIKAINDLPNALRFYDGYVGITYKVYGEHNITVSQTAPTTALPSGCMHNVY
ncbi:MAG: hypothetical protein ACK5MV_10575 [Aminipila sp.]